MQTEMDREQHKFDDLSARLSQLTDHASAEFKNISCQLVKSQDILALMTTDIYHSNILL